ncbi:MAG: hypothetical protein P8M21_00085, partial [Halioglobus sp.]|nr:hypothetical protein [Halioglobus sp.]
MFTTSKKRFFLSIFLLTLLISGRSEAVEIIKSSDPSGSASSPVTVFTAKEIITLDPEKPLAYAVAVQDDRIV